MSITNEIISTEFGPTTVEVYTCDAKGCENKILTETPAGWLELKRLGDFHTLGDRLANGLHACSIDHAVVVLQESD